MRMPPFLTIEREVLALSPRFHPEEAHERQRYDVLVEVCSHGGDKQEHGVLVHE